MRIRSLCVKTLTAGILLPAALSGCKSDSYATFRESRVYMPHIGLPWLSRDAGHSGTLELAHPPVTSASPEQSWSHSYPEHRLLPSGPELADPPLAQPPLAPRATPEHPPVPPAPALPPETDYFPMEPGGPALQKPAEVPPEPDDSEHDASRHNDPRRFGRNAMEARRSPSTMPTRSTESAKPTTESPRIFHSLGANVRGMFDAVRNHLPGGVNEVTTKEDTKATDELTPENREMIARMFEENGRSALAQQFRAGVQSAEIRETQPHTTAQRPALIPPQPNYSTSHDEKLGSVTAASRTLELPATEKKSTSLPNATVDNPSMRWGHTLVPGGTTIESSAVKPVSGRLEQSNEPLPLVPVLTVSEPEELLPTWPHAPQAPVRSESTETAGSVTHANTSGARSPTGEISRAPEIVQEAAPVMNQPAPKRERLPYTGILITPGPSTR